jgi:radical SAM protein with 4Fe4S-binding SPASM domain
MRRDIFDLIAYASGKGIRTVLSTNGTLITPQTAERLREAGVNYVGVSLDGLEATNDRFRGKKGAFREALEGIRNARATGLKVGLRFTLTRFNFKDLEPIFQLAEQEVTRLCIYHLVYSGRAAARARGIAISPQETRQAMEVICRKVVEFHERDLPMEVLTVDNHADGPFIYLKLLETQPERAQEVYELLRRNGGNSSGVGIGAVDNLGFVHADQFWHHYSFGNVKERPFSQIWEDTSDPIMRGLKERKGLIKGRCAVCRFFELCNGNFRVRAEAVFGDIWEHDPACYLTDEEIGVPSTVKSWSI